MCEYGDEDVADDYECEYERVNQNILDFAKELKAPLLTRKNSKQTEPASTASKQTDQQQTEPASTASKQTEQPTRKNKTKQSIQPF